MKHLEQRLTKKDGARNLGVVKWYDRTKGFGVIVEPGGSESFLRDRNFENHNIKPFRGSAVIFEREKLSRPGKAPLALDARFVSSTDLDRLIALTGSGVICSFNLSIGRYKTEIKRIALPLIEFGITTMLSLMDWDDLPHEIEEIIMHSLTIDTLDTSEFLINLWNGYSKAFPAFQSKTSLVKYQSNFGEVIARQSTLFDEETKVRLWLHKEFPCFRDEDLKADSLPFSPKYFVSNVYDVTVDVVERLSYFSTKQDDFQEILSSWLDTEEHLQTQEIFKVCCALLAKLDKCARQKAFQRIIAQLDSELFLDLITRHQVGFDFIGKNVVFSNNQIVGRVPHELLTRTLPICNAIQFRKLVKSTDDFANVVAVISSSEALQKKLGDIDTFFWLFERARDLGQEDALPWNFFPESFWVSAFGKNMVAFSELDISVLDIKIPNKEMAEGSILPAALQCLASERGKNVKILPLLLSVQRFAYHLISDVNHHLSIELTNKEISEALSNSELISDTDVVSFLLSKVNFSDTVDGAIRHDLRIILSLLENTTSSCISDFLDRRRDEISDLPLTAKLDILEICQNQDLSWLNKILLAEISQIDDETQFDEWKAIRALKMLEADRVDAARIIHRKESWTLEAYLSLLRHFPKGAIQSDSYRFNRYFNNNNVIQPTALRLAVKLLNEKHQMIGVDLLEALEKGDYKEVVEINDLTELVKVEYRPKVINAIILTIKDDDLLFSFVEFLNHNHVLQKQHFSGLKESLRIVLHRFPRLGLEFALNLGPAGIKFAIQEFRLTHTSFAEVTTFFQKPEHLRAFIPFESENSMGFFFRSFSAQDENNLARSIQCFTTSTGHKFDLDFLRFLLFVSANGEWQFNRFDVLKSFHTPILSARLLKTFLTENDSADYSVINALNNTLKQHFEILNTEDYNLDEDFELLFSLKKLVKPCDGRAHTEGMKLWGSYGKERFYSKGFSTVSKSKYDTPCNYCEGRPWKEVEVWNGHSNTPTGQSVKLHWCRGGVCAKPNSILNLEQVQNWTLLEFSHVFKKGLNRLKLSSISGWLNRMEELISKLHCAGCNSILRPLPFVPSRLGHYAVPLFQCVNGKCPEFSKQIRFTHCRGCKTILDSRECNSCKSCGWLICSNDSCKECGCGYEGKQIYYSK